MSTLGVDDARLRVVQAVNENSSQFGIAYVEEDGTLVVQFVDEGAKVLLMSNIPDGLAIRWERVTYSRDELRRIAAEISDLELNGVFAVSSGTKSNRVVVKVFPGGPVEEVRAAVATFGAAVYVEESTDVPAVLPADH
jgi:hypothetical protein